MSYYGILRISKLLILSFQDIVIDIEKSRLIANIQFSKTELFGKGEKVYIYDNKLDYSPYKIFNFLRDNYNEN